MLHLFCNGFIGRVEKMNSFEFFHKFQFCNPIYFLILFKIYLEI